MKQTKENKTGETFNSMLDRLGKAPKATQRYVVVSLDKTLSQVFFQSNNFSECGDFVDNNTDRENLKVLSDTAYLRRVEKLEQGGNNE